MKNTLKKLSALALSLCICLSVLAIGPAASAAAAPADRSLRYNQNADGSVILSITGTSTSRLIHGVQLELTLDGDIDPNEVKLAPSESGSYSPAFGTLVSKANGRTTVALYVVSDYAMNLDGHIDLGALTVDGLPAAPLSAKISILDSSHMQNGTSPLPLEDLPMRPAQGTDTWGDSYKVKLLVTASGGEVSAPPTAREGQIVPVRLTPDEGNEVASIRVGNGSIPVTKVEDGLYTFKMPAENASVRVAFGPKGGDEPGPDIPLPFKDVNESHWFYNEVNYVYQHKLMDGVSADRFAPYTETNRGMIVTILYRLEGEPEISEPSGYVDVPEGQWYSDAVAWANANDIVNGYPGNVYRPRQSVTRQELAAILYRYAKYKGYDVSASADLSTFTDQGSVLGYAVEPMRWAVGMGLIKGKGNDITLAPRGRANRAETAAILQRFATSQDNGPSGD